mmetsp:Transcript_2562/g.6045  ORF Transcript_2562/g.6045 Transcript_2562/m.6045 type:complete len:225 (-) Transcript_2562:399-1073(-)
MEECHPDVEPVPGLPEVGRPGVVVDLLGDFVHAGQRVHEDGPRPHVAHQGAVHREGAARAGVVIRLGPVQVALLLDPRLVQHVHAARNLLEVVYFAPVGALLVEVRLDVVLHPGDGRGDEEELDAVELGQHVGEGAGGAAVREVAHERHLGAGHVAQLLMDGVQVQERLRRVLPGAVACVDHRHRRGRRRQPRRTRLEVPEHDQVHVLLKRAHRVLERFPFRDG